MSEDERLMRCLLTAFPDRLARRREVGKSTGIMVGGKGVCLDRSSGVASAELFVCVEVQDQPHEALVRQASAVEEAWLDPTHITEREELYFHPIQRQVVARKRRYWMDLLLRETPVAVTQADQAQHLLFEAARADLSQVLPDEFGSLDLFRQRVACLNGWIPEWNLPPVDASMLEQVLLQLCHQARSFHDLRKAPWDDWIRGRFSTEQLRLIDREAPERIQTPKGHWLKIEYQAGKPPVLAVKIQDIFAWKETPRIALGRVPLLLHLLAPNMRPQQVTDDLPSFWRTTYHVVRKELKRRYPKHPWPEDPQGVG
jgi:ATP-dependent helicase HrpB